MAIQRRHQSNQGDKTNDWRRDEAKEEQTEVQWEDDSRLIVV